MKILRGADLWDFLHLNHWVVVTTNTVVKKNGKAVMGSGIAKDAADRFPHLPKAYGTYLKAAAERSDIAVIPLIGLVLFPTKYNWSDPSDLELIRKNAVQLANRFAEHNILHHENPISRVFLPPIGTGLGSLNWQDVEKVLSSILDDNFTIVFRETPKT